MRTRSRASRHDGAATVAALTLPVASWEERWPANVQGAARALTVLSPISPYWARWLRFYFGLWRILPSLGAFFARPLERLSFIHFARWTLIEQLPGPEGRARPGLESTWRSTPGPTPSAMAFSARQHRHHRDFMRGDNGARSGKMTLQGDAPTFLAPAHPLVVTRGGEYLYQPGITALHALGQLDAGPGRRRPRRGSEPSRVA